MSLISRFVSVSILLASSVGCRVEMAPTDEGRLDVVIRPDSGAASSRPVQGTFVLHDQDGHTVDQLAVVSLYETLSVALREGTYLLEWQPALSFESAEDVAAREREGASVGVVPVLIAAGRVTTVNVRAALVPSADAEIATRDTGLPSVDILIARH
jgi:hypothetical protein